jgi:hypothetical protein
MATGLASRIIVVSPDVAFGQRLASALEPLAPVDVHDTLDRAGAIEPSLWIIHLAREQVPATSTLPARLAGGAPIIVVSPGSDLTSVVQVMQSSSRLAGMLVAEEVDLGRLAATASGILTEPPFGLERVMAAGTEIHTHTIGDYLEKSRCMTLIAELVDQHGVPRKYREPIEQCIDEMLMNALYDAPVGPQGEHLFAGVPTKKRITLRTEQRVVLQYAFDGTRFAVSVRDAFGSLDRDTVLRHLDKGLHAEDKIDHKLGGAGVGLYLMVNSATAVQFTVIPSVATEALCVFDVAAPKRELAQLGFVQLPAAGRLPTGPASVLPGPALPLSPSQLRRRRLVRGASVLLTAMTVAAGVMAWPYLFPPDTRAHLILTTIPNGATVELGGRVVGTTTDGTLIVRDLDPGRAYPVTVRLRGHEVKQSVVQPHVGENAVTFELQAVATVVLDSDPAGATIEVDGKPMGSTPLTLTSLVPGSTVQIVFARMGYRPVTATVKVPAAGQATQVVRPLERSEDLVRVRFVSNPPGAEVVRPGQPVSTDRTYTPAEVFVEADKVQHFMLTMPRHVPLVIEPFTAARGDDGLEKGGELVEGVTLRLEATRPGKVTVADAPHCRAVAVPADCILAPGSYVVEHVATDGAKTARTVVVGNEDKTERL